MIVFTRDLKNGVAALELQAKAWPRATTLSLRSNAATVQANPLYSDFKKGVAALELQAKAWPRATTLSLRSNAATVQVNPL